MDYEKIKKGVQLIIDGIGEDSTREGLVETPDRIAKMYAEIFSGLGKDASEILSKDFTAAGNDVIIQKNITFYSMCEHHFLPFFGKAHIAYIPKDRVVGLSKLARTVEIYAKKPQLQERLNCEVADALMKYLDTKGVMVVIEAEHMCMTMRGVKNQGARTMTCVCKGDFETNFELRKEVFSMINISSSSEIVIPAEHK